VTQKSLVDFIDKNNVMDFWRKLTPLQQEAIHRYHQGAVTSQKEELEKCVNERKRLSVTLNKKNDLSTPEFKRWCKSMIAHWDSIGVLLIVFTHSKVYKILRGDKWQDNQAKQR